MMKCFTFWWADSFHRVNSGKISRIYKVNMNEIRWKHRSEEMRNKEFIDMNCFENYSNVSVVWELNSVPSLLIPIVLLIGCFGQARGFGFYSWFQILCSLFVPFSRGWGLCLFFFNGEFDPGSGLTLAACLTHASRTMKGACSWISGERVSNTWVTCP